MDTKEISIVEDTTTAIAIDKTDYMAKCNEYLESMGNTLPANQRTQFIELATAFHLNPFKREIYAVGYGDKWNIITGYEVYIKRAERTGNLDGWKVDVDGNGDNMTATITIYRKDWKYPFSHTVLFSECCQKTKDGKLNNIWSKMPSFMLRKVAIAQGFRLCFPDEFSGMPYTSDELPEIEMRDVTPKADPKKEKKSAPKQEKKFTDEQASKLGEIMTQTYEDGTPIFTQDERNSYRDMLIDGLFEDAYKMASEELETRKKPF
jgi:phage recombination protein Bet